MGFKVLTSGGAVKTGTSASTDLATASGTLPFGHLSAGMLIGIQRITATGAYTYTPTIGTTFIIFEIQGAGGGGGGCVSPTGSNVSAGGSGGGGGWIRHRLNANFSGATGSVGAGGAGGAAGNNAGTTGGNTTFVSTVPTTYTAAGGVGGSGGGASSVASWFPVAAGGACTNGDEQTPGGPAEFSGAITVTSTKSGRGGNSHYSMGGLGVRAQGANQTAAGVAATGKGGGGTGGAATGTGAAAAGGAGSDGIVIIWEFGT